MSKNNNKCANSTFPKFYYLTKRFLDDPRYYTMCAKVERVNEKNLLYRTNVCGTPVIVPFDGHHMKLTVGWAICYDDNYNEEYGNRLAKSRLKNRPVSVMYSDYNGEFKESIVRAIMDAKCDYIHDNLEHFIPENKEEIEIEIVSLPESETICECINKLADNTVDEVTDEPMETKPKKTDFEIFSDMIDSLDHSLAIMKNVKML